MPDINKPMDIPELNLQPPITGKVKLSPDMQQTLSLLCGLGNEQRVPLRASAEGILLTDEPQIKDVVILTGIQVNGEAYGTNQGSNVPCSNVMIMGHPDNTDRVWVRPYNAVDATHGWPLDKKEVVMFSVDNLNRVHFLYDTAEEKVIIAYTR